MFPMARLTVLTVCLIYLSHGGEGNKVDQLKAIVTELARQVQLQQFAFEEQTRMNGGSGLKQQRASIIGSRPYYTETHTGLKIARIHDHANHINTVGMGESVFVLNGVEFRTRHNDYPLYMPHRTSSAYNTIEKIPFPEVPPEVANKSTVDEQIAEMKLWFKAWKDQDSSVRDYRKYFKPALCYMEGAWYLAKNRLEESFHSDRHFIDALTWVELQDKVRFNAYTGRKNVLENYAYLPRKLFNISESGMPEYAQWNYRVLCHPLSRDVPFKHLVQEDDLQARMLYRRSLKDFKEMRGARFRIEGPSERVAPFTLLDRMMQEIPGRDNYQGYLTETALGDKYMDLAYRNKTLLNVARYHRSFLNGKKDASGQSRGKLGFSDPNLFVAETTQEKIAPMYVRMCTHKGKNKCYEAVKRVTYAIPLEIIYMTPLHNWNPYNLTYITNMGLREYTNHGKRKGGFTPSTAYPGTTSAQFYTTPTEFFGSGKVKEAGPADTAAPSIGILDPDGNVRRVSASGFRIHLPEIEGLGSLRTRWPIMPIHGEASPVWKELNALKDVVLNLKSNQKYLNEPLPSGGGKPPKGKPAKEMTSLVLRTSPAWESKDRHTHTVFLTTEQRHTIIRGKGQVRVTTSVDSGHSHELLVQSKDGKPFVMAEADGKPPPTEDGHTDHLRFDRINFSDGTSVVRS